MTNLLHDLVDHFQKKAADDGETLFNTIDKFLKTKIAKGKLEGAGANIARDVCDYMHPGLADSQEARTTNDLSEYIHNRKMPDNSSADYWRGTVKVDGVPLDLQTPDEQQKRIEDRFKVPTGEVVDPLAKEPLKRVADRDGQVVPYVDFKWGGSPGGKPNILKIIGEIKELESTVAEVNELRGRVRGIDYMERDDGTIVILEREANGTLIADRIIELDGSITYLRNPEA